MSNEAVIGLPAETRLILATRNDHKVAEIRAMLMQHLPDIPALAVVGASGLSLPEPVEDELTFKGNAIIKARQLAKATGLYAIADDSGICVNALGGAPGVFSARWSGVHGDDSANLALLIAQLREVPQRHRGASFRAAMALVGPAGQEWVTEGQMDGEIAFEPRGENGFGYDPIFIPNGFTCTNAELSATEKNKISHRAQAIAKMVSIIEKQLVW